MIKERTKGAKSIRSIGLWNGEDEDEDDDAASMLSRNDVLGRTDAISFRLEVEPRKDWTQGSDLLRSANPLSYVEKKVFKDRPGVG